MPIPECSDRKMTDNIEKYRKATHMLLDELNDTESIRQIYLLVDYLVLNEPPKDFIGCTPKSSSGGKIYERIANF